MRRDCSPNLEPAIRHVAISLPSAASWLLRLSDAGRAAPSGPQSPPTQALSCCSPPALRSQLQTLPSSYTNGFAVGLGRDDTALVAAWFVGLAPVLWVMVANRSRALLQPPVDEGEVLDSASAPRRLPRRAFLTSSVATLGGVVTTSFLRPLGASASSVRQVELEPTTADAALVQKVLANPQFQRALSTLGVTNASLDTAAARSVLIPLSDAAGISEGVLCPIVWIPINSGAGGMMFYSEGPTLSPVLLTGRWQGSYDATKPGTFTATTLVGDELYTLTPSGWTAASGASVIRIA